MGYAARFWTQDPGTGAWQGEHRPELVDLSHLFRLLPNLDLAALDQKGDARLSPERVSPEGTVVRPHSDLEGARLAWSRVLPLGVELVGLLGPNVAHVRFAEPAQAKEVVIKLVRPSPDRGPLAVLRRFQPSRARRAHLWAHRLRALGMPAPRPLGVLERASQGRRHPSFVVYEYMAGATLKERAAELSGQAFARERRLLIERVADLYRSLHARGIFHADLHAGNLLVTGEGVVPIDLVSIRHFALPGRAAVKNLARLNRDFLDTQALSRADRFRFLSAYLRGSASAEERKRRLFSAVLAETRSKLEQYGEAFRSSRNSAYDALDAPTLEDPVTARPGEPREPPHVGGE